ncbi:type VII secretion protein [Streptomyces sp. 796.1]|uniref:type VII secretion protein n=1 Tax=Streptomyces sp. 796.1 TaxID=3163029 RepID=UPI0039C8F925
MSRDDWQRSVLKSIGVQGAAAKTEQPPSAGAAPGAARTRAQESSATDRSPRAEGQTAGAEPVATAGHHTASAPAPHTPQHQPPQHQQQAHQATGVPAASERPAGPEPDIAAAARQSLPPAPESLPVLPPALASAGGRQRRGESVPRRSLRALRGAFGSSAARAVAVETRLAQELQQPVTTGRQIVVTSIRGGAGKTTVAALLSRVYNHYRHDPVLTLEADAALGTLPARLGAPSVRWSCADLAQLVVPSMQLTDVTGYLVPLTDGGWLLPAGQGRVGSRVDIPTYRTVTVALRRYFGITVIDCETLPGEVARTAVDTAHAHVLVAPATVEGVAGTRAVVEWLATLPRPATARTVVALTTSTPHASLDLKAASAHLREAGPAVFTLPYDRHLAAGGPVQTRLLASATRQAAIRLAAEVLGRAVTAR